MVRPVIIIIALALTFLSGTEIATAQTYTRGANAYGITIGGGINSYGTDRALWMPNKNVHFHAGLAMEFGLFILIVQTGKNMVSGTCCDPYGKYTASGKSTHSSEDTRF